MGIRLLCGPANAGKVGIVLERVRDAARAGGAWLLVPTDADARRVREELAADGAALGMRVGTFHALVRECAAAPTAAVADAGVERFIMRRVLEGSAVKRVPELAESARWGGFLDTAVRHVSALRAARVAGPSAEDDAARLVPGPVAPWWRLATAWAGAIERSGRHDDAWTVSRALEQVASGRWRTPVFTYGFDDFSPTQRRLLEELGRHVEVLIAMPYVPGRTVFERRTALVTDLVRSGAELDVIGTAEFDEPLLAQLEAAWCEDTAEELDPGSLDGTGAIRLIECCGALQEAEEAVRTVAQLIGEGIPPAQIAVLGVDLTGSRPLFEYALRRAGIPASIELPRQLNETPAGRALLLLLDAVLEDDPTLAAAFARTHMSGRDGAVADQWERSVRKVRALQGTRPAPGWWVSAVSSSRTGESGWSPVPPALASLSSAVRGADVDVDALIQSLGELVPQDDGDVRLIASAVSTIRALTSITSGRRPPTLAEIRDVLGSGHLPPPTHRHDGAIVVAPIQGVRTDRFDAVVLVGMHDDGFRPSPDDPDEAPVVARELAYTAITRPRRVLVAIRQVADGNGATLAPHPSWLELQRLVSGAQIRRRGLRDVVPSAAEVLLPAEVLAAAALAVGEGIQIVGVPADVEQRVRGACTPIARAERTVLSEVGELVRDRPTSTVRVTEIETYLSCGVRWMIDRIIEPDRDPDDDVAALVQGSLAHTVLEELVPRYVTRDGVLIANAELEAAIDASLERAAHAVRTAAWDPKPVWAVDVAIARERVLRFLREDRLAGDAVEVEVAIADPAHAEVGEFVIPGLVEDGLTISGKVDRIDLAADGSVVLQDYKIGSARRPSRGRAKLLGANQLQLLLYWRSIEQAGIDRSGIRWDPVAALYRPLRNGKAEGAIIDGYAPAGIGITRTDVADREAIEELLDGAEEKARGAVGDMLAGVVSLAPEPTWDDACRMCSWLNVCRRDEVHAASAAAMTEEVGS